MSRSSDTRGDSPRGLYSAPAGRTCVVVHRARPVLAFSKEVMRGLDDPRINDRIRSPQVRLVGADGGRSGWFPPRTRSEQARDLDLDLVEVAPQADPPVCRIMDYGKYKYERDIRQKEARKKQSRVEVKEIKFRPKIDRHDYATKKGHVERFLRAGARSRSPSCSAGERWRTRISDARSWTS